MGNVNIDKGKLFGSLFKYIVLPIGLVVGLVFGVKHLADSGMFNKVAQTSGSSVPDKLALPNLPSAAPANVAQASSADSSLPGNEPAAVQGPVVKVLEMAWNSASSTNLANGGKVTKRGSLMEKLHVNVQISRQDDCGQQVNELVAMASDLYDRRKRGDASEPDKGVQFVHFMGDAGAAFAEQFRQKLKGLPPEYQAEIIGFSGKSFGEDQFMGPGVWHENPQRAKGAVVICVKEDGDCNIVIKWSADNQICLNPDPATYDAECVNLMYPDGDFIKTTAMFNAKTTSQRKVVRGPNAGKTVEKFADGLSTWTPADEQAFNGPRKGEIVTIVSTRNYESQMAGTFFGIKKWDEEHSDTVVNFLDATFRAARQINQADQTKKRVALHRAAEANADIWGENPGYWEKYFKGSVQTDGDGREISHIGGSSVADLADNLVYYGLAGAEFGKPYKDVYEGFGNYMVKYYPGDVPSYPPYDSVVNTTYLRKLQQQAGAVSFESAVPTFTGKPMAAEAAISRSTWHINFASGKADILPSSQATVGQIATQAMQASNTAIRIDGYTDDVGEEKPGGHEANIALSEKRAQALVHALQMRSSRYFPDNRFTVVGNGYDKPVEPGKSPKARAANRRVEVAFGENVKVAQAR